MKSGCRWVRPLARATPLLVGLAFLTLQLSAAEVAAPSNKRPMTLQGAVDASVARLATSKRMAAQTAPTSSSGGEHSFLASPKGAAVLVLLAGVVGFTIYSAHHDRVHSPVR